MVLANNQIDNNKSYTSIAGNFDPHADASVRCGAHQPMGHILGFIRSHWITPSGKSLHRIAPTAIMVNEFFEHIKY